MTDFERDLLIASIAGGIATIVVFKYALDFFVPLAKKLYKKLATAQSKDKEKEKKKEEAPKEKKEKGEKTNARLSLPKITFPKLTTPLVFKLMPRFASLFIVIGGYIFVGVFVSKYFFARPYIIHTVPNHGALYADPHVPLSVLFDRPFNQETLNLKIMPDDLTVDVDYRPVYEDFSKFLESVTGVNIEIPLYIGIEIEPKRSIAYEQKVVFYMSGLQSTTGNGGQHEHSYEVHTPDNPKVISTSIADLQGDVLPHAPLEIEFDNPITDAMTLVAEITPQVEYEIVRDSEKQMQIRYKQPLQQGTDYVIKVFKVAQLVELESKEVLNAEDPELLGTLRFKTVTPPGLESVAPQGNAVRVKTPIVMNFTEPVERETVEQLFTVEPAVNGTIMWESDTKMTFTPDEEYLKETWYSVILKSGIRTKKGGITYTDIIHKFETIGAVKVTGFSPWNGAKSVSVTSSMRIDFDQPVDHGDAQSKVAISPGVNAAYGWDGNTLVIDPKGNLAYNTQYKVTINPDVKSIEGTNSRETFTYSFTTQPETVTLSIPRYTQGAGTFVCNVVAARMALAYRGVHISNDQLINAIGRGEDYNSSGPSGGNPNTHWIQYYGTHWEPLARGIRNWRGAEARSGMSLSQIASEIRNGNPVIIFWYNGVSNQTMNSWYSAHGARPGMHSVTVYGYKGPESNPTHILVKDPWFSKETYTAGEFNAKWAYLGRKAVVVK